MSKDILSGVAFTVGLFSVSVFMPIIGFFCAMFIPLPVIYYRLKLGRQTGAMVPVLTLMVMVMMIGKLSVDTLAFSELLLLGFVLGELFEHDLPVEKTILYASGSVLLAASAILVFYSGWSNTSALALVTAYVGQNLELTLAMYRNMGVSEEAVQVLSDSMDQIRYMLVRIIPGLAAVSVMFISWSNLLMARSVLKQRGMTPPDFGRLNQWQAPEHLVWGAIVCGILVMMTAKAFKLIGINGLLVFLTVYFFQGIAIVSFFFEKKNFPRMLRIVLYSMIALQQAFVLAVIGLGLFDIWLNFRKLGRENSA